jgi:hypothetical protein
MQHRQRRTQFVRHIGDEIAADLFEPRERRNIAHDEQHVLARIRNQPKRQTDVFVIRRRDFAQHFRGRIVRDPRLRRRGQKRIDVRTPIARRGQTEQARCRFVEPQHRAARRQHHDTIG